MASFFGTKGTPSNPTPPATGLRVQTSAQGKPVPIGWGQGRIANNLIWYGDFVATPHAQSQGGGGKGGGGGGNTGVTYTYTAAVAMAICEGPVTSILSAWNNKTLVTLASLNLTAFLGSYSQSAWGYLTSLHPTDALNFRGLAYAAAGPMDLGDSANLPNLSFEVKFAICDAISGAPDADARDVVIDALTNPYYGVGYPSARIGTLDVFSAYCRATGMVVSPIITDQQEASKLVSELLAGLNSEAVMSGGVLDIVPRGDQSITANGATYTAPSAPEYDLTDDDFLPFGEPNPIKIKRTAQQDRQNIVSVEYLDRSNSYNPVAIDAKDDASISVFGERPTVQESRHFFALADAAQLSAQLELGRLQIAASFEFIIPPKYIRLNPMDIVSLTRISQGLSRTWVRITEIQENDDYSLSMTAEEYLAGTGAAPIYGNQASNGYVPNEDVSAGAINDPVIFEPTAQLAGAGVLEVWAAVSGIDTTFWGGANVFVSYDDLTYDLVGKITAPARTGSLTAILPVGAAVDQTNTLSVSLSECNGSLISGSQADVDALNTLCYVNGELLAYRDAALVSANNYNLTYLVRGAYGTTANIVSHGIGTRFARLDQNVIKIPYNQSRIGATLYIKFCSFNIYGRAVQQLSDVTAVLYTIQGTGLPVVPLSPRIDHYTGLTVPSTGYTITFMPDGSSSALPFTSGPSVGGVLQPTPAMTGTSGTPSALTLVVDSISLSSVTFHFESTGTPTTATGCDVQAEGY